MSQGKKKILPALFTLAILTLCIVAGCASAKSDHGPATVHQSTSVTTSFLNPVVTASVGDKVAEAAIKATIGYLGGILPDAEKIAAAKAGLKAAIEEAEKEGKQLSEINKKDIENGLLARLREPYERP